MTDEIEQPELRVIPPDVFGMFRDFVALITDPVACKVRQREFQQAQDATATGQAQLAAERVLFAQEMATARAEIASKRAALEKRRVAAHQDQLAIAEAGKHMAKLIDAWKFVGDDNPLVRSGLMEAQFTPLENARRAFASVSVQADNPAEAAESADDEPVAQFPQDDFPAHLTITREPVVRVRGGRSQRVRADQ